MPRLRHVAGDALTIERRRVGRGFSFVQADGRPVRDPETRQRIRDLAIPPAWTDVGIAADPLAHIQAKGTDAAGRTQYIYHAEWEVRRTRRKQRHLTALAAALPRVRRRVRRDLEAEAGDKNLALAIAIALIDRTAMRIGRERYLIANGTRGAVTLYTQDVIVAGDEIRLRFPAKSGKVAAYRIKDGRLADAIARIKTLRGRRLLLYHGMDGTPRPLNSQDLNAYLQEITDAPITAKDFRTLHGSALAGEELARLVPGSSASARKRQLAAVMRRVAGFLQNTPAISRQSYVAPHLIDLFEKGKLCDAWAVEEANGTGLRRREACLAAVLAGA